MRFNIHFDLNKLEYNLCNIYSHIYRFRNFRTSDGLCYLLGSEFDSMEETRRKIAKG